MEVSVSCEGESKGRGAPSWREHTSDTNNNSKRDSWISSSSNSGAAVHTAAAAAAAGSPQRLQSSHTIDEIRARLKPRVQSGGAGVAGLSTTVSSLEALPLSPLPLRLRLQSDGSAPAAAAAAAAAAVVAATTPRVETGISATGEAAAAAAATAAEGSAFIHRGGESPRFRRSGTDCLDTVLRRRQAAAEAAAAANQGKPAAVALGPAEQADCLVMLHELLAFTEALEAHRQQAVSEAARLRRYNAEMFSMLQQANAREQQLFQELLGQRGLLAETHSKQQMLQRSAEEATGSLRKQRDSLLERLQVVETELERCTRENEQLLRQHAVDRASLQELAAIRQSHGLIEREKKQLQSELEAQSVASSRLLNERIELQGQLHRLQSRLQDVEATDPTRFARGEAMKQRVFPVGTGGSEETDEEGAAEVLLLLQQLVSEASPHLSEARRQELLQQGPAKGVLDAFVQIRSEKNEFHGYALELLNRLDALGTPCPSIPCSQHATAETCATAASLAAEEAAAAASAAAAAAPVPSSEKGSSSSGSSAMRGPEAVTQQE
ncbi:hypothetical protein Esti_003876 [Eimeria stiedai]